jgi:hypothetical protein
MTMDAETEPWVLPGTSRLVVALAVPALISTALAALELGRMRSPSETRPWQCHSKVELARTVEGKRIEAIDRTERSGRCAPSKSFP